MAVYYVASITPVAYPAFFDHCDGRLPETFGEWRVLEDIARRDLVARGHHVIGLPVELVGFRDHCRLLNCRADRAALTTFATRIGNDHFGTHESYDAVRARVGVVEDTRAGPVVVEDTRAVVLEEVPPRRHWWQFWRRSRSLARRRPLATRVEDTRAGPVVMGDTRAEPVILEEVPPRRHWWQFWRRPRTLDRRRPLAARIA